MRIILCGFGVVGQSLSKLLLSRAEDLYARYGLKPRIVGVYDSKGSAVDSSGLDLNQLLQVKKKNGTIKKYRTGKSNVKVIDMINSLDAELFLLHE